MLNKIKKRIRNDYRLYFLFKKIIGNSNLIVDNKTDVCIEGFPRCANTFTVVAFSTVNPKLKVAHHMHTIAQLKGALKYKIPIVIVIRKPNEAIKSYLVRNNKVSVTEAIEYYESFYSFVLENKELLIISDFDDSIKCFDKIIQKTNIKYKKNFNVFSPTKHEVDKVFKIIEDISASSDKASGVLGTARPNIVKEKYKNKINLSSFSLDKCNKLYERIVNRD